VIPDEEIERVREAADIVSIIGESVPLKRAGAAFRGACPFHQGKNPNFSVDPRRRIYHCFKCGESGDVFTYLRKRFGLDWPSAVRMVAEKSGLELREVSSRREGPDPREPIWEVNAAAEDFFRRTLRDDPAGQPGRDYLASREVGMDLADRFGLGFAPSGTALSERLHALGFDDARLLQAGLLVEREGGAPRPRFRGRLMFTIYDLGGRVAGFGGRVIGAGEPKYLNSPETLAFSKGRLLYGLNWARNAIRRADRALVVEGYFDVLRVMAAGVEEVVAPLGTALTPDQAGLIVRSSKNVFLLYDSDKAGLKATFRSGDELLRHDAAVRVVTLPSGEDPDSYALRAGRDGIERALADSVDILERKIQVLERSGWFADLHRRRRAIDHLLPTIRAATDPVTRDLYVGRVAQATGVDRSILGAEVDPVDEDVPGRHVRRLSPASVRPPDRPAERGVRRPVTSTPGASAERELVRVLLTVPGQMERIAERIGPGEFRDARYREIFERLMQPLPDEGTTALALRLSPPAAEALEALLAEPGAIVDVERTVSDSLAKLDLRSRQDQSDEIQRLMVAATGAEKDRLMKEKQAISEEIRRLRTGIQSS
jgi:DNA primase